MAQSVTSIPMWPTAEAKDLWKNYRTEMAQSQHEVNIFGVGNDVHKGTPSKGNGIYRANSDILKILGYNFGTFAFDVETFKDINGPFGNLSEYHVLHTVTDDVYHKLIDVLFLNNDYPSNDRNAKNTKLKLYINNENVCEWYLRLLSLQQMHTEKNPAGYKHKTRTSIYRRFHFGLLPVQNNNELKCNDWLLCFESNLSAEESKINTKEPFMVGIGVYNERELMVPLIHIFEKYRNNIVIKIKSHISRIQAMQGKSIKLEVVSSFDAPIILLDKVPQANNNNSNNNNSNAMSPIMSNANYDENALDNDVNSLMLSYCNTYAHSMFDRNEYHNNNYNNNNNMKDLPLPMYSPNNVPHPSQYNHNNNNNNNNNSNMNIDLLPNQNMIPFNNNPMFSINHQYSNHNNNNNNINNMSNIQLIAQQLYSLKYSMNEQMDRLKHEIDHLKDQMNQKVDNVLSQVAWCANNYHSNVYGSHDSNMSDIHLSPNVDAISFDGFHSLPFSEPENKKRHLNNNNINNMAVNDNEPPFKKPRFNE